MANKPHVYDLAETTSADMMPKYFFIAGRGPVMQNGKVILKSSYYYSTCFNGSQLEKMHMKAPDMPLP